MTMPDTRVLAKDWVEKNIPPNSKVLMDSGKYYLGIYRTAASFESLDSGAVHRKG